MARVLTEVGEVMPNITEELKETAEKVGQLVPVLVNQKGEVIDGRHRLKANRNWKRMKIPLNEMETHVARVVINSTRRIVEDEDYEELADYLIKKEHLKRGQIANRISELTNISPRTVRYHLPARYIADTGREMDTSTISEQPTYRIPKPLLEPVRRISELVRENPEIVKDVTDALEMTRSIGHASMKAKKTKPERSREEVGRREPNVHTFWKWVASPYQYEFVNELPASMIRSLLEESGEPKLMRTQIGIVIRNCEGTAEKLRKAIEA